MDDRVHAAQRVAEGLRLGEVAERDLHAHALGRPAAAGSRTRQRTGSPRAVSRAQQGTADGAGGAGEQEHADASRIPPPESDIKANPWPTSSPSPASDTKDNSCVEVCPVDCIHPTPDEPDYDKVELLFIDPEECIDCDACVEACPVDACFAEDQLPDEWPKYTQLNAEYFS